MSNRVLIVDDLPENVELLEAFLEGIADATLGLTESKGVEQAFIEFKPDLVLLDLHMPDPDGLEVLRRLRSARASLGVLPVIMLTGDSGPVARNSAFTLGANDFLTKPLDRHEVVLRVRSLLRIRDLFLQVKSGEVGGA